MKRILGYVFILAVLAAFLALLLMLLWNAFLVPAVGVAALSYLMALKGVGFAYFIGGAIMVIKSNLEFVAVSASLFIANKKMSRELDEHKSLLRHFPDFFGGGRQEKDE